ncbi:hypothetical protein PF010_g29434 [Phytophthora fragariae]|uniref:Uncharacterized protein n=1 Tax=Phytophthora fragariae TaxID=53985 RepID=A0A6A3VBH4_9STRA|nr:hypothetical protein PF006_g31270 [Phytophthora fragariae]KAE9062361.1 hypothetical protein PF010_g29434 [Phytophthora fragariae]KAE9164515.1 hypothetical protein PF002_g31581 [Phytophthora fragariae]
MVEVSIKAVAMDARAVPPSTFTPLLANLACSDVSSWGNTRKPRKVGLVYVKVVVSAQSTLKSWAQDSTDCVSVQKGKR